MRDEKFVGLRPKLYSYEYEEEGKNTKLTLADYEHSLRILDVKAVSMNTIRSDHHKIYSLSTKKIGLSGWYQYTCTWTLTRIIILFSNFNCII